jgi:hypothetical protein
MKNLSRIEKTNQQKKNFLCGKVGNSEKSSELKIQNGQFEKREGFGIRSAPRQGQHCLSFWCKIRVYKVGS